MTTTDPTQIDSLLALADAAAGEVIYLRYSWDHEADIRRGYSRNHQDMSREPGLSVQSIEPEDHAAPSWVARLVSDYSSRVLLNDGAYGWLCRGRVAGTDADGCPALVDVQFVARLSGRLVSACQRFARDTHERHRTNRANDPRPWPAASDYGI